MKRITKNSILGVAMLLTPTALFAAQPYGGCWHPSDIKEWNKESYKDYKFNRSMVPLKPRVERSEKMRANDKQRENGGITNATILYPRCSAAPSQGDYTFTAYQPTYWQYVDKLVYWAGSASEGIIIPPPAPTIDAAHQEGVKILGQVFFPPTYYGGKREWVREMLTCTDGQYPYAIKLFEIARDLGFDGWFINEETGGGSNEEWVGFINEFYRAAKDAGCDWMEIQWYNASRYPNVDILKTDLQTSQFLEYGAIGDKSSYAESLNCTNEDVFNKLYAGVECAQTGLMGVSNSLNGAFPPEMDHVCSLALFCPEEHTWKDNVRDILDKEDTGESAYQAVSKVFEVEEMLWVNDLADPSQLSTRWRGVSGAINERSAVTELPFSSDMSVGVGKHRFVKGEIKGSRDWHHTGVQSVLPTWRWWIENRGDLKVSVDWDDAYNLGSSFRINGTLSAGNHLMRLYKTDIELSSDVVVRLYYKGETPELVVSTNGTTEPDNDFIEKIADVTDAGGGWQCAEWILKSLAGKRLNMLGLNLIATKDVKDYAFSLGRIEIFDSSENIEAQTITDAVVDAELGQEGGDASVMWSYERVKGFDHFDVYSDCGDGECLVGQTRGEAFYLPDIKRKPGNDKVSVRIVPVMKNDVEGISSELEITFPALEKPDVTFKLSKSYIKVGESCTLTAKANNFATYAEWSVGEGLEITPTDDPFVVTIKGLTEGSHQAKVVVTNAVGSTTFEAVAVDVLSEKDYNSVGNIMKGKKIHSFSGSANSSEVPSNLIDGIRNPSSVSMKWCSLDAVNEVIFDCLSSQRLYGVKIFDCKAGPEDAENFHSYTIEVSDDLKDWKKVIDETGLQNVDIKEDYVSPFECRYIRFRPQVAGVLRVWEFEAIGLGAESAVSDIISSAKEIVSIYTVDGLRVSEIGTGVYIVCYSDGTFNKIIGGK